MINSAYQFIDVIRAEGLQPPAYIEPGRLYRFPGVGKSTSNRAGWCLLFDDGLGGCYGDWSTGLVESWHSNHQKNYSADEHTAFIVRANEAKKQAEKARINKYRTSAKRASNIWQASTPVPTKHPYLIKKSIQPHVARLHKGFLTLPVLDFNGDLTSLQFIDDDGQKRLLSGGRKQGCFIPVCHEILSPAHIVICEGWATGCTLAENDDRLTVLAAIDAGNLKTVAMQARNKWPSAELVIAGDDDRLTLGNPGATKAKDAALASGAMLATPQWPVDAPIHLSDFNDLAVWLAGGAV